MPKVEIDVELSEFLRPVVHWNTKEIRSLLTRLKPSSVCHELVLWKEVDRELAKYGAYVFHLEVDLKASQAATNYYAKKWRRSKKFFSAAREVTLSLRKMLRVRGVLDSQLPRMEIGAQGEMDNG